MANSTPKSYSTDPALYVYTSLTSGSSHIVTATSRLETILKANKIPFKAIDIATDEKARMLWGRRSGKDESGRVRKIPGLVQMGLVVGDLVEIEEWNEYGELKEHVTIYHEGGAPPKSAGPTPSSTPAKVAAPVSQENKTPEPTAVAESSKDAESKAPAGAQPTSFTLAMRQAGEEAAQKAKDTKKKVTETFTGVGEGEPEKEAVEKEETKAKPPSISLAQNLSPKHKYITSTILQSPTSTAWKRASGSTPVHSAEAGAGPLQSPNSTAWKPTDTYPPILTHRGSSVSEASAEYIKQIEDDAAIPEEDEENSEGAVKD